MARAEAPAKWKLPKMSSGTSCVFADFHTRNTICICWIHWEVMYYYPSTEYGCSYMGAKVTWPHHENSWSSPQVNFISREIFHSVRAVVKRISSEFLSAAQRYSTFILSSSLNCTNNHWNLTSKFVWNFIIFLVFKMDRKNFNILGGSALMLSAFSSQ